MMPERIINWLQTVSWPEAALVFFAENMAIFLVVTFLGEWVVSRFNSQRVALRPRPVSAIEITVVTLNVLLNTATTLAGLWLWRRGIIQLRSDVGLFVIVDVLVLLLGMDLMMYVLHRIAHTRILFSLLHRFHHRYDRPRPLTLFALSPVENLAFGSLWLIFISLYTASWLGIAIYLTLNLLFGALGHLGVEPFPLTWAKKPVLKYLAGGSFHAQHHQDIEHNYGFYTLIWDRLLGTVRPDYEQNFGQVPNWIEERAK